MWTIRQEQLEVFENAGLQGFEDQMVEHLRGFAPRHCQIMSEREIRQVIRLGVDRGKHYGLTYRGPVRFYVELMFMFGSYFDTDPQYPWAGKVLTGLDPLEQIVRADHLYDEMSDYLELVAGPKNMYAIEALQRLSQFPIESFSVPTSNLEDHILSELKRIYPQKHDYLGDQVLRDLIHHSFKIGTDYGLSTDKELLFMTILAFAAGHQFPVDPLHGWIARRLNSHRGLSPQIRFERVQSAARTYLRSIMKGEESLNVSDRM
jgi:hypothetical protein